QEREQALAELQEAQQIAQLGSWQWDPATGTRTWSAGMYAVYGCDPAAGPMDTDESFASVHADDLERVRGAYARMRQHSVGFELDYRLVTADGITRAVHAIARPDPDQPGCYRGTLQDVTERKRAEEELRLRAELLDLAHDAVIVREPVESRVTFWNREAQAIYGYSREEALGRVTHELLATVFPESTEAVDDVLAQEGRWVGELRHTRKDGEVIVVASRQALQRGSDGRASAIIELNSDITEQKRAEEGLAHIAGLLERTEEISNTGGWEYDVATGELTWTDEVFRIYGVERKSDPTEVTEAIAAYDPDSAPIIDAAFKRLVAEGEPYDLELGLIRADGQRVWVRTVGRPVIDDGRVVRVGGNISDVSERKRVEEALRASDQLFHSGFDYSPTGMALVGLDGRLVEVNAAFARMLGFDDPAQLAGRDFARYTHPDDVAANREGIRMMVEERKPYVADKRYIRTDGAVVYALMGSTAVLDADGRPSTLFMQVQDITERKHAEAALRASEERFRGGFDYSPIGMALVGLDGSYVEVNTTFARMLGFADPTQLAGQSFTNFIHPDELALGQAAPQRVLESGTERGERRYIRRDGAVVHLLYGATVVRDADGRPSVFFAQFQDITERKLAEAEVRRLNAELEQRVLQRTAELRAANQELEGFAYSLAHDLRAPIRAINGFGAALSMNHGDELGDQGRETLDRIRRASAKMGELIDAMLLLSALTRRELSITGVDLSAVTSEIGEELRALDPTRRVEFVIAGGLKTVGDQGLVRVLMRNLLDNAWKYTSLQENARIEVMRAGAGVFAVSDNGVGFNMAFADMLFKPFARLHREDEFPGIGVGLTTVERIVRRHGGAVWGEGRLGEGATFYFKLEPSTETGS
ncbi:MAG: PAS domain S-box protein, partial [Solirubrobacteraceae bacterium]